MDRAQISRPTERELVFCHECENEWFREEHGLACPQCRSEFTEIIEASHDPRTGLMGDLSDDEPEPQRHSATGHTRASHDSPSQHPLHDHNPWADTPDPEEDDINRFHFHQSGPGSFTVTGTFVGNMPPRMGNSGSDRGSDSQQGVTHNFMSMLQGILGNNAGMESSQRSTRQQQQQQQQQHHTHGADFPPLGASQHPELGARDQNFGSGRHMETDGPRFSFVGGGPNHRFHYSSSARVFPRDANHPQPHMEPVDNLQEMLQSIFGPEGPLTPGAPPPGPRFGPPHRAETPFGNNSLLGILAQLLGPPGFQGDYVLSQEHLDRVISGLMDQNATGSAPGPASQAAIDALVKKKVDGKMLGAEGRAECSICMDEVNIGEEVTELPCGHWFHGACVSAWLSEHDTCPHCRKGISGQSSSPGFQSSEAQEGRPVHPQASHPGPSTPTRTMPGSFEPSSPLSVSGNGSRSQPFADERPATMSRHSSQSYGRSQSGRRQSTSSARSDGATANEGIAGRIRRGLFGSSSRRPSGGTGH